MGYKYGLIIAAVLLIGMSIGYLLTLTFAAPRATPIAPATTVTTTITIPSVTSIRETVTVTTVKTETISVKLEKRSVIDAFGRLIEFERIPSRVISLAPSVTEKLFALGLENVVIGVDSYSDYPEKVLELVNENRISVVGGPWTPDLEKIIALNPELVILCRGVRPQESLYPKLEEVGIKTAFLLCDNAKNQYDIYSDLYTLGVIFAVEERAKSVSDDIQRRLDETLLKLKEANVSKVRVLVLIGPPSWGIYSAGGDTFIGWLIDRAGGINIAKAYSGWPQLDYEFILNNDPEVIIITSHGIDPKDLYNELLNTPIVKTSAWMNRKIYLFTDEANDVLCRPGPRIVTALEILAHILHPEVLGEIQRTDVYRITE
ncbi:MAG: helical backbone metal receptor [Ignisphaera sp.]